MELVIPALRLLIATLASVRVVFARVSDLTEIVRKGPLVPGFLCVSLSSIAK